MRDFTAKKARELKPSGIRKFFDIASQEKDVVSLGVGEPDFITPWNVRDAGVQAIKRGYTQYTSNMGLPALRENISKYLKTRFDVDFEPSNTMVTLGASEAIDVSLRAVLDEGDEVLIPDPSYVSYAPCVSLAGGVPVAVPCFNEDAFRLSPEQLEKVITPKTKVLIFPYPNNPTGAIMEKEYIEKLIPVILKYDLLVIADEIYAELTYGQKHVSIASFEKLDGRVILIGGFSKAFAMTGWRIGFACAKGTLFSARLKIHQYTAICAPTFSQYAALQALEEGLTDNFSAVTEMVQEYDRRRKFMLKEFRAMGLDCFEPKGAFYIFPSLKNLGMDGEAFANKLLKEEKVAVVPGNAFGESGTYHIRCSYAYSLDSLTFSMNKIKKFVERQKKNK